MSLQHAAEAVRQKGRGEDTMLIHMTPEEVGGLQALAMAHGGKLTINPETGLPEANFLKSILPTLIGAGLMMIPGMQGVGAGFLGGTAGMIGMGVGALETLRTGDLGKGLMAGLGAYGGAGLAGGALAAGQAAGQTAAQQGATTMQATQPTLAQTANMSPVADVGRTLTPMETAIMKADRGSMITGGFSPAPPPPPTAFENVLANAQTYTPYQEATTVAGRFAEAGSGLGNIVGATGTEATQAAARSAGMEALGGSATSAAMRGAAALAGPLTAVPPAPTVEPEESNYDGPYVPTPRQVRFPTDRDPADSSEFQYFDVVNPAPGFQTMASAAPQATATSGGGFINDVANTAANTYRQAVDLSGEPRFAGIPVSLATNPDRMREYQANPNLYSFAEGGGASIKTAPASYVAGRDAEFNYGFQPMANVQPAQQGLGGVQIGPGTGFAGTNLTGAQHAQLAADQFKRFHPKFGPQLRAAGYAEGGGLNMDDGGFVVDAHTVSEIGNGSSDAGHMMLAKIGGEPIKGPGDGTSDSIKANIGGTVPARVAKDESYLSREDVKALGGGDMKKGEKMLYRLMAKAHESRKNKGRGEATGLDKLIQRMA